MHRRLTGRQYLTVLAIGSVCATPIYAQDNGFADDFTVDTTALTVDQFNGSSEFFSVTPSSDGLSLQIDATAEQFGNVVINPRDASDAVEIDWTYDSANAYSDAAQVFLQSTVYNDADEPDSRDGDVFVQLDYNRFEDDSFQVSYCLFRQPDGADRETIGEFGSEFCDFLAEGTVSAGIRNSLGFSVDRDAGTIEVRFDDQVRTVSPPGNFFTPSEDRSSIVFSVATDNSGQNTALATLHEIRQDGIVQNFAGFPADAFQRYQPLDDVNGVERTASHANGRLTLTAQSFDGDNTNNILRLSDQSDYFETTLVLSNATDLGDQGRVLAEVVHYLYNDIAEGGVDGSDIGRVRARLEIELRANGQRSLIYCLERRDEDGERSGLLTSGERCELFPVAVEFDVPYRLAIDFDRDNGTVTLRANEFESVNAVDGPFFANEPGRTTEIVAGPRDSATVVVEIDEIRTSPTALTESEIASGATAPTPFPAVASEPPPANSTIAFPFAAETIPVDHIDDFSSDTSQLAFEAFPEETLAGIAYVSNGLQLEAATGPEEDSGEVFLRVQEATDFLAMRASLSRATRLPIDDDARAQVRLDGTWYNDTQEGGFDDRGGDVFVQLRLDLRGNGRRQASFCFSRRNGSGDNEDLDIVDGEPCGEFSVVPQFDTEHELSMTIDRAAATMTFTFDEETRTVDLGSQVFTAARGERRVLVRHQGESGRVVGIVHSVSTTSGEVNFETDMPLIGPYRPAFETSSPGREIAVVDGRLRIESDSAVSEGNQPRFLTRNPSDFVSALIEVSSESRLDRGRIDLGVGGQMYNDIADGGLEAGNNEGAVFGLTRMVFNDDGEDYIEYCAFRSNTSDFSDAVQIVGNDSENCPRFTTVPTLDTPLDLLVSLDRERGVLVFSAGDESAEHSITTGIFTPSSFFNGISGNAFDGSRLVGFVDNLAFAENPIPLAESDALIGVVANDAGGSTDSEAGISGGSSGGGGCSIASGSGGMGAPMLALLALLAPRWRRRLVRRANR